MKKIININLSSRLIPIEDSAYEILRQYLDSLKRYFSQEEGAEEIVGDIESRIAEIFQDKIRKGAHCITDEDVQAIKTSMGTPEQFADEPLNNTKESKSHASNESYASYARPRKRFYRDPDSKVLGGVCSGLGAYFNVDPIVFRIVFALMAVGLWGGGILLYFILWFATPEAVTAAEKLEMRGERVDLNNIKATVQEEMNTFRSRMERMGDDVKNFSEGRGKQFGRDAGTAIEGFFRGLANVIAFVAKGFFLFIAVVILFTIVVGLIGAAAFSAVLFPIKDLVFDAGTQSLLFWPAISLLIGIPVLAIIMFLVRKMAGIRQTNKYAGYTLGFFWILGVVLSIWLAISVSRDFNGPTIRESESFALTQPSGGRLILEKDQDMLDLDDTNIFDGKLRVVDDTAIIGHIRINVKKSNTDSFAVEVEKSSIGRTVAQAKMLAREIQFQMKQQDSVLLIPSGFSIPRNSIFRNQTIKLTIMVPVGKSLVVDREVWNYYRWDRNWRNEWWDNRDGDDWDNNDQINIKMNTDGWEKKVKEEERKERSVKDSLQNNYQYKGPDQQNTTPVEDSKEKDSAAKDKKNVAVSFVNFLFRSTF
ncbi:PspC domain-containing protein [Chitinophaga sp. SYP-B3965]|uniref:PspC domain-containing protein n=1 Tax=Chitinophaga sp. SYP-B3965 TaxID=2663120 RepID=UPI001299E218|nr:PspC domain-containing protein [Chitinophaga sp. SYP-B3965]MRG46517.1 PspC domain-containing protein [Chitinophaga sp. SYP-B3965]